MPMTRVTSLGPRVVAALILSCCGTVAFFLSAFGVLSAMMPAGMGTELPWWLRQPWGSLLMYGPGFCAAGLGCQAIGRLWLGGSWGQAATAMHLPYAFATFVPLAAGLAHMSLSSNPIGFIHTRITYYLLPVIGGFCSLTVGTLLKLLARREAANK